MENRKQLYQQRSVSMCIEHTFDFVRVNISSWLFVSALLLAVPSIVLAFLYTKSHLGAQPNVIDVFPAFIQSFSYLSLIPIFFSLFASILVSYTLLSAYLDGRLPGKRLSLKETWKYMRDILWKALSLMVLAAILIFPMTQHVLLFLIIAIIGVPLLLLAPIWVVEKRDFSDALQGAFRFGFKSWLEIILMVLLITLLCLMMMMSVTYPWVLYEMLVQNVWIPNGVSASSVFLIQIVELLLTAFFFYVFFLMTSVVVLSCVFYYGSASETIDDVTLENDIENFENL